MLADSKEFTKFVLLPGAAALVLAVLFWRMPELDLRASAHFYHAETKFAEGRIGFWQWIYLLIDPLSKIFFFGAAALAALEWWKKRPMLGVDRKAALYIGLALLLGPGVLVHDVIKEQWGRPRPSQVQEFGGEQIFTPAWVMSDQCPKNCSFVSGHASIGFFLISFAFLTRKYFALWMAAGIAFGLLSGLARIAQGGHFVSDVIFAGFAVYFCSLLVFRCLYRHWPPRTRYESAQVKAAEAP